MDKINNFLNKPLPIGKNWTKLKTVDMHTGGEPLRIITEGLPELKADNVLDYRRQFMQDYDYIRKALMREPRGHTDMYGAVLIPPNDESSDLGVIFLHNEGYSTMCGHAVIAISKLAFSANWFPNKKQDEPLLIDAPCGRIQCFLNEKSGELNSTGFECVPSFVLCTNKEIRINDLGLVKYDIAFGGAFYAYVDADEIGLSLNSTNYSDLVRYGMAIKNGIIKQGVDISHPFEQDLSFLYGTIFTSKEASTGNDSKNVCVFADGQVDRSPTGSGVSGRMALHYFKNEIEIGKRMRIESIVGSVFTGYAKEAVDFGPFKAVIPYVEGTAFITGSHDFYIDPNDPLGEGFLLG